MKTLIKMIVLAAILCCAAYAEIPVNEPISKGVHTLSWTASEYGIKILFDTTSQAEWILLRIAYVEEGEVKLTYAIVQPIRDPLGLGIHFPNAVTAPAKPGSTLVSVLALELWTFQETYFD